MNLKNGFSGQTAPKYRLDESDSVTAPLGNQLYRIFALRDFADIKAGDKGGYIEKESNLSHDDTAWVSGNARVYGKAKVSDNAWVSGNARLSGNATVTGNARVSGNAQVGANARISGGACVAGNAYVADNAHVSGDVLLTDYAQALNNVRISTGTFTSRISPLPHLYRY